MLAYGNIWASHFKLKVFCFLHLCNALRFEYMVLGVDIHPSKYPAGTLCGEGAQQPICFVEAPVLSGFIGHGFGHFIKVGQFISLQFFFTNPCNRQADQSSSSSLANPLAISSCCTCCFGCIFGMYSLHLFPKVLTIRALCRQDSPWAPIIEFIALTFFPCAVQVSCNHYSVMVLLGCTRHQSI